MNTSFPSSKKKYVTPSTELFVVWEEFNILNGTGDVDANTDKNLVDPTDPEAGNWAKSTNRSSRSIFFNDYEPTISDEENAYE